MLSERLIRMIEDHAEALSRGVTRDLQCNPQTPSYHQLSSEELHRRVSKAYRELGRWLADDSETAFENFYGDLGKKRCQEGIPLSEVIYALILTKYHLRDYVRTSGLGDSAEELRQELELHRLLNNCFDKAIHFAAKGYEREAKLLNEPSATHAPTP